MWVTFRLYWVPDAMPRVVALEFYFWHTVLVSLCLVAYYGHVGSGPHCRSQVCGKGYHGIKTFFPCTECLCVCGQSCIRAHTPYKQYRNILAAHYKGWRLSLVSFCIVTEPFVDRVVSSLGRVSVWYVWNLRFWGDFGWSSIFHCIPHYTYFHTVLLVWRNENLYTPFSIPS